MMEENPMHHCDQLPDVSADSDDSDDSESSNRSIERPPSFRNLNLELKGSIEELKSELDRNHQTLNDKTKELDDTIDELESMHRNTTVGSLVGSSVGAAGGIMSIVGLCLAPFTLGASLALTVGGAAIGVAGGVTGGASNITNVVRQKTLRENIEKIINELQTTIKPTGKLLNKINKITEALNKLDSQRAARDGSEDVLKIAGVASLTILGKICAESAKEIRVFVKAVYAARGAASAARAVRASAEAVKEVRVASAFAGAFAAAFLALDVYFIVKDSKELSEMNQPAGKRKEQTISSETLKFILQIKEVVKQFKKIVKKIKNFI